MIYTRRYARIGIASKGIVYFLLGIMALITAVNLNNALKNEEEIIQWIYQLTYGWFLLLILTIGLTGYIFSRIFLTFNRYDYDGTTSKPYYRRVAYLINGLGYCLLLFTCISVLSGTYDQDDPGYKFMILQSTLGKSLVYLIAIGLGISAINEWWISFSSMLKKMIHSDLMSPVQYKYLLFLGRVGRFSRGFVFAVFSYILARSAYYDLQNIPEGADAAFAFINANSGAFIMGSIAFGVMCYGLFLMISGRHRNIPIKKPLF